MIDAYISIEAAAQLSGLHPNTLRRLLRERVVRGRKLVVAGKRRWTVSAESLRDYLAPSLRFAAIQPAPKLRLRSRKLGQ